MFDGRCVRVIPLEVVRLRCLLRRDEVFSMLQRGHRVGVHADLRAVLLPELDLSVEVTGSSVLAPSTSPTVIKTSLSCNRER